jgi:hypothetical protein
MEHPPQVELFKYFCTILKSATTSVIAVKESPNTTFRGSSVVEQVAVNDLVVGSNPTRGAKIDSLVNAPTGWGVYFTSNFWCFKCRLLTRMSHN